MTIEELTRRRYEDNEVEFHLVDPFEDDEVRLLQSKGDRRLPKKTQVYPQPKNSHMRSRSSHTKEVFSIALYIADALNLNKSLVRAIAIGHDQGHVPFGHLGEKVLKDLSGKPFSHAVFGVVLAQHIERKGKGLNLTKATLLGILNHTRGKNNLVSNLNLPQECDVVMFADKIAYIFSDINDALRYNEFREKDLPAVIHLLGKNQREQIYTVVTALVEESKAKGRVSFSKGNKIFEYFEELRQWMYANVYEKVNRPIQVAYIHAVHDYFNRLPELQDFDASLLIALMTDAEVLKLGSDLGCAYKPSWPELRNLGFVELLPDLRGKEINFIDPDLDW